MNYENKTKGELISELKSLKSKVENFEYKQSEGELKKAVTLMTNVINSTPDLIFVKDMKLRTIMCNKAFANATGKKPDEMIGKTDIENGWDPELVHGNPEKGIRGFENDDRQALKGNEVHNPVDPANVGDGIQFFDTKKLPLRDTDGRIFGVLGIARDITEKRLVEEELKKYRNQLEEQVTERTIELTTTNKKLKLEIAERKKTEKILQKSEEKFRRLIENLQDNYFFYAHNTDGIFTYISPSLTNILGYSVGEFLTHYSEYLTENPINKRVVGHTELSIKGIKQPPYEVEIYHKDGTIRSLHVQETPIFDDNRNVIAVEGIAQDITEHQKMEKELMKVQKLESVSMLAGGIAHDFNNSLQVILGYISLAGVHTNSIKEIHGYLEEARKAVFQSRSLTQQLLTFSKGGDPVKKTISVSETIMGSTKLALSGSNVRYEFGIPDNLWRIDADKGQLNQVISNLIINSDQAMPEGGNIKVWAENINVVEKDSLRLQEGRYVKITVEDQGTGISQEHLQKIFDPYFTTKQKGSGLGLSTAYSIVKKHDGHITVESETGVGTTFHVYLPASEKESPKEFIRKKVDELGNNHSEKKDAGKPAASKGKILVMDDEHTIRTILCKHLRILKYEVEAVGEGLEAIRLYKGASETGKPFNAVVMDLTIAGGMGGRETIKKLLEIDSEVKAIVSSGYANDPIMTDSYKIWF